MDGKGEKSRGKASEKLEREREKKRLWTQRNIAARDVLWTKKKRPFLTEALCCRC